MSTRNAAIWLLAVLGLFVIANSRRSSAHATAQEPAAAKASPAEGYNVHVLAPHLESEGFEIEMEMITKMKRLGFEMFSVPITYDEREGETKIDSIRDGIKILSMFAKNLSWSPTTKNQRQILIKNKSGAI